MGKLVYFWENKFSHQLFYRSPIHFLFKRELFHKVISKSEFQCSRYQFYYRIAVFELFLERSRVESHIVFLSAGGN